MTKRNFSEIHSPDAAIDRINSPRSRVSNYLFSLPRTIPLVRSRREINRPRLSSPRSESISSQSFRGIETDAVTTFSPGVRGFLPAPALGPPCWFFSSTRAKLRGRVLNNQQAIRPGRKKGPSEKGPP